MVQYKFSFDERNLPTIIDVHGHQRSIPKLIDAPFRYSTFAVEYLRTAQKYTKYPLKQAVIAPSALSIVHMTESIDQYSREEFLSDLINEAEKDVRQCLEAGADKVQLDFAKTELTLNMKQNAKLLKEFIEINNRLLNRFSQEEQKKIGVHVCSGEFLVFHFRHFRDSIK